MTDKALQAAKANPITTATLLLGLMGGGTLAKFHLFDELVNPMKAIIYHQKISNYIETGITLHDAEDKAEEDMIYDGWWKSRGAE